MPVTRHVDRLAEYVEFREDPDLPLLSFLNLHVFVQSDPHEPSTRTSVDADPIFEEIRGLSILLLSSMARSLSAWRFLTVILGRIVVGCSVSRASDREVLKTKLGSERYLERADATRSLLEETPTIIFKHLEDHDGIVWGRVVKGEEEGAIANEMSISMEILRALRGAMRLRTFHSAPHDPILNELHTASTTSLHEDDRNAARQTPSSLFCGLCAPTCALPHKSLLRSRPNSRNWSALRTACTGSPD
ncbi:hypothetical protein B0H11DRAFT_433114 [Mycena galericulata]|nr:hypothetical protein B0H11DRAFT_433114 [Mycena galericulata]